MFFLNKIIIIILLLYLLLEQSEVEGVWGEVGREEGGAVGGEAPRLESSSFCNKQYIDINEYIPYYIVKSMNVLKNFHFNSEQILTK